MTTLKIVFAIPAVIVAILASAVAGASFAIGMVFLILTMSHLPF